MNMKNFNQEEDEKTLNKKNFEYKRAGKNKERGDWFNKSEKRLNAYSRKEKFRNW